MRASHVLIGLAFALILGVPFLTRPSAPDRALAAQGKARRLVIVTPHVAQIQQEFGEAFARWHAAAYPDEAPVEIDWRTPGGTSEIVKQLQAVYNAAIASGPITPDGRCAPGVVPYDIVMGGGSFDHTRLKLGDGVSARVPALVEGKAVTTTRPVPMSVPAGFDQQRLDDWFGENAVGSGRLYDPEQYWLGTALSSFGIVFNRDVVARLGLAPPADFDDLTDPRLAGWIALSDPRQSGSVTTTFDSILSYHGWDRGWRILRELTANARYFTNSSTKPPIDVAQGDAAAGLAIDFYGRTQAQYVARPGQPPEEARVGYVDPPGSVAIDADPVSILRGGPSPDLARRFVEFCLSVQGQALWQFPPHESLAAPPPDGLGPRRYALRRLPVRRDMYRDHADRMIDKVDPFAIASRARVGVWRTAIGLMMGAFAIDTADLQRRAWRAILDARATPGFDPATLERMEERFFAWPDTPIEPGDTLAADATLIDGTTLARGTAADRPGLVPFTESNYRAIRGVWDDPRRRARLQVAYARFFSDAYRDVVRLHRNAPRNHPP